MNNAGTLNINHDAAQSGYYVHAFGSGTEPHFRNLPGGTMTKTAAGSLTYINNATFDNDGVVQVTGGTFRVSGSGLAPGDSGSYNAAAGTTLEFSDNRTITGPVTAAGQHLVLGRDHEHRGRLQRRQPDGHHRWAGQLQQLRLAVGLQFAHPCRRHRGGSGFLEISGVYRWLGGDMTDVGFTTIRPAATIRLDGASSRTLHGNRTLFNQGLVPVGRDERLHARRRLPGRRDDLQRGHHRDPEQRDDQRRSRRQDRQPRA